MSFRDVIASLPAQRLLPGHGVADLVFFFLVLIAQLSSERAFLASTFVRWGERRSSHRHDGKERGAHCRSRARQHVARDVVATIASLIR